MGQCGNVLSRKTGQSVRMPGNSSVASKKKSRSKRGASFASLPSIPPAQQLIDIGRKVTVTVKKASVEDVVLSLSDGTKLHLKPVVMSIERSLKKYNAAGEPIYQISVGLMVNTTVPPRLKKKLKRGAKRP
jgi:hypothetical protein